MLADLGEQFHSFVQTKSKWNVGSAVVQEALIGLECRAPAPLHPPTHTTRRVFLTTSESKWFDPPHLTWTFAL